jgi:predicted DNA-binding protein (MmcQ/YjbR family)
VLGHEDLRRACLARPGASEEHPFGERTSVFKVAAKMFALAPLAETPLRISLKCEPDLAVQLRRSHDAITPGYHLPKRHWNTVVLDGSLSDAMVLDLIEDSYDLVVAGLSRPARARLAQG